MARYRVYLSDVSYFSGKLESALRAKRIDYQRVRITPAILLREVLPNTGWMKVPAVRRDDGLWLCDTTPLLAWLDAQHPERALLPADEYRGFLSALVEDYCDEWQWRPAMFWRWAWPDNARYVAAQLGRELSAGMPVPASVMGAWFRRRQQRIFLRGDGVNAETFDAIAALYPKALAWLERLLTGRRYLLGARPSLVDIAWLGPMLRHYAQDPRPAAVMAAQAPKVWAWVTRVWNSGAEEWPRGELEDFSERAWDDIFRDMGEGYLPYLRDNAAALAAGQRRFSGGYGGIRYTNLPAVHYRARCLNTLQRRYAALSAPVKTKVAARLGRWSIVEALQRQSPLPRAPTIESAVAGPRREFNWRERLLLNLTGTPWDPAR